MTAPAPPTRVYIDGNTPTKAHESDAAFDLRSSASSTIVIDPGGRCLIPCGFAIAIPEGHVGLVCSRSGLAFHKSVFVVNAPGVIDPGYRGDVCAILGNFGEEQFHVRPGDRIAQLLIVPTLNVQLVQNKNALAATDRGSTGFGSTGVA